MTTIHALMRHPCRVPRVVHPQAEGRFRLPDGRRLGFAEFDGPLGSKDANPSDDFLYWYNMITKIPGGGN